jgi:Uma2 family endonuclease
MSSDVLHREATYEDLLKVPDHLVAEIVEGELFTSPRPGLRHAEATGSLYSQLRRLFDENGGSWWFAFEPELHLGRDVFVPDIAGWRRERMPVPPDVSACELAPDWICETISTKTARLDRYRKLPRYAAHQIPHAWLVDPEVFGVEVYRLDRDHWTLIATHEGSPVIRAEPFEAGEINLGAMWLESRAPEREPHA